MKRVLGSAAIASIAMFNSSMAQQLPPADAKAGECYAKVLIPAKYQTSAEQVVAQPASTTFKKTPAVYREIEKSILIEEESYELVPVPPVYELVSEQVLVQPEQTVKSVIPATYRDAIKKVLVSPARVEWKVGRGAYEKIDAATGEIMCRVEVPAVFKEISQKVIDQPARTNEEVVPARYETIQRRVMKNPPTTRKKIIPAKYRTVKIKELIEAEKFEVIETPARYASVQKRALMASETVQWRQILCETNTTPGIVLRLQNALIGAGYKLGFTPDGELGPGTLAVISRFQQDNNLPTGGLTLSTIQKLGVEL
ncbi:MAG: peptidoglycan-binding protein [Rhizobiaceae bacterium]|nr:peptidoglycan-binding protein [Rhizobiaceae bacterium]